MKIVDFFEVILELGAEFSFLTSCSSVHWLFWRCDLSGRRLAEAIEAVWEIRASNLKIRKICHFAQPLKRGSYLACSVVGGGGEGDLVLKRQPCQQNFHASFCLLWKHLAFQEPLRGLRRDRHVCSLRKATCIQASGRSN